MKRRNKKKWLKENPEWEEWNYLLEIGMLIQIWFRKEEGPRLGYLVKNGDGSFGAKLFDECFIGVNHREKWVFTLKEK
jgi:hypothetical protein